MQRVVKITLGFLTATSSVLLASGVYLSVLVGDGNLASRLLATYVFQGYLVGAIVSGVLALVVLALSSKPGRLVVLIASVIFLNIIFLWTTRGVPDSEYVNMLVTPIVVALTGVGVDTGIGISVIDLFFLMVFLIAAASAFLLSQGFLRSVLNSAWLLAGLLVVLSMDVYIWDRGEFLMHFTELSPVWFSNYVLVVVALPIFGLITAAQVYLRLMRAPHSTL